MAFAGNSVRTIGSIAALSSALLGSPHTASASETSDPTEATSPTQGRGYYLNQDGRLTNARQRYSKLHAPPKAHYLRAGLEDVVLLAGGTAWYFIDDRNVLDWDFPSMKQRVTGEAWTYDNNQFGMNFVLHPFSGAAFYALPRANGLSVHTSFWYGFATSFLWEFVIEFNEKVSVNDLIMTPGGGFVIGEFFHKLAWYLNSAPRPTTRHRVMQWTFGLTQRMHDAYDGVTKEPTVTDRHGYSADFWRRFNATYELTSLERRVPSGTASGEVGPQALHNVSFSGEIVTIPGHLRPGHFHTGFRQADVVSLTAEVEGSSFGSGVLVDAHTIMAGYYGQKLERRGASLLGHSIAAGAGAGYRYRSTQAVGIDERLGAFHFPGPSADFRLVSPFISLRVLGSLHADFVGVSDPAFERWHAENDDTRPKSILLKQGYYYGWGASARAGIEVTSGPFDLSTHLFYGRYRSHEGLDRTQDVVKDDVHSRGHVLLMKGQALLRPNQGPFAAGLKVGLRDYVFNTGGLRENHRATDVGLHLQTTF